VAAQTVTAFLHDGTGTDRSFFGPDRKESGWILVWATLQWWFGQGVPYRMRILLPSARVTVLSPTEVPQTAQV